MSSKKFAALLALSAFACAPQEPAASASDQVTGEASVFTFAPQVGKTFEHTMTRFEEVQIVGTPMRQAEERETTWKITVGQEVDLIVYQAELVALKVSVNGAQILKGDEVTGQGGTMAIPRRSS